MVNGSKAFITVAMIEILFIEETSSAAVDRRISWDVPGA